MSCDNLTEVRRPQERKVLLFPWKKKTPESCHTARTTTKETNQTEQPNVDFFNECFIIYAL